MDWLNEILAWLSQIIGWANQNDGFIMAVLTAVYVIATLLIVHQAQRTNRTQQAALAQTEALEQARTRPYMVFSLDFERHIVSSGFSSFALYAVVQNVGLSSAHDVRVETTPAINAQWGPENPPRKLAIVGNP